MYTFFPSVTRQTYQELITVYREHEGGFLLAGLANGKVAIFTVQELLQVMPNMTWMKV